jgi:hypothetical protein
MSTQVFLSTRAGTEGVLLTFDLARAAQDTLVVSWTRSSASSRAPVIAQAARYSRSR